MNFFGKELAKRDDLYYNRDKILCDREVFGMMPISEKIHSIAPSPTLAIEEKVKAMQADGVDVIGFGAGQPDFDTPEHIKEAAIKAIRDGFTKYTPASGIKELKEAVCSKLLKDNALEYTPANIVISNGAKQCLVNALMAICNPGDEVILPTPYWVSYPEMIKLADGVPVLLPTTEESHFKFTVEELEQKVTDRTRAVIINSPSNPTGMLYSHAELKKIGELAVEKGFYIISDEIYEKLIYEGVKHVSIAAISDEIKDHTILVNGLSKSHSMTGWRIGYTASNATVAKAMANLQSHATSNPNSIAQKAAVAALNGPQDCVEMMRATFEERRNYMVERINQMEGLSCKKPAGAFYVMMNVSALFGQELYGYQIQDSNDFCEALLEVAKVAVVSGVGFAADGFVRLSYATSMDNIEKGLDRIERFVKKEF